MTITSAKFILRFYATGDPIPKQSCKKGADGQGGYTPEQTRQWEDTVRVFARNAMQLQDQDCTDRRLRAALEFILPDRHRRELDSLSKAVLEAMKHIVYVDDHQIFDLALSKVYQDEMPRDGSVPAGVSVYIHEQ